MSVPLLSALVVSPARCWKKPLMPGLIMRTIDRGPVYARNAA